MFGPSHREQAKLQFSYVQVFSYKIKFYLHSKHSSAVLTHDTQLVLHTLQVVPSR